MNFIRIFLFTFICSLLTYSCKETSVSNTTGKYLDGEFWRQQGLTQIIPFWQAHVRDTVNGAYYLYLSREGNPMPPWNKYPPMISRQIYGFTSAYLLSGDEKYLKTAREGVDFLLKHAWDNQYGGWFDMLDSAGNPTQTTKSVPNQIYTNVGLAQYYFATKDEDVLKYIKESIRIHKKYSFDKDKGGYFQTLARDLSVSDSIKTKHGHFGYTSSLLINMMMYTRDEEMRDFAEELMQISFDKMRDPVNGWFNGFPDHYDSNWKHIQAISNNKNIVSSGGQLTAALSLMRLYGITGNEIYRTTWTGLNDQLQNAAWDSTRGCWFELIERDAPYTVQDTSSISWWIQSYGILIQLHLYHATGDKKYLDTYKKMAAFWSNFFVDKEYGSVFMNVTADGVPKALNKAISWKASYHEMENALLNYLYVTLYVNHRPATLFFHINNSSEGSKHYVSNIEDSSVQIKSVKINGKIWNKFDAAERSVTLPEGKDLKMEVTLAEKLY